MTHEQKIESLSNEIRKALPYLMEFSEGCLIEDTYNSIVYKIACTDKNANNDIFNVWALDIKNMFALRCFIYKSYHKIIGHEPMLNDVLAWLAIIQNSLLLISVCGTIYNGEHGEIDSTNVYWNIEKPYLKEQSEELINFLYSLIKQ